jgi:hypothetical protein
LIHILAAAAPLCIGGCMRSGSAAPTAGDVTLLVAQTSNAGAVADAESASEARLIEIARRAVEQRENRADWPFGADYQLIRRSAVQSWVIARRVTGHDAAGNPRYAEPWDRGIIIDELGHVMFYVPAR